MSVVSGPEEEVYSRLRLHPALPYMERVATKDDILPLAIPLTKPDGTHITQLPIKAGQVIIKLMCLT